MDTRIELFVRNQFGLFNENFIDSLSVKAGDHIHDFRIAAKRIKMISDFICMLNDHPGIKTMFQSSGIRDAFKSAGRYREIHVNRHLLAELEGLMMTKFITIREELRFMETKSKRYFIRMWKDFPYERFYNLEFTMLMNLGPLTYDHFTGKLAEFVERSLNSIRELIISGGTKQKLHIARKEIKKIKYALEWLDLQSGSFGTLNFSHRKITMIEDKIGVWHDWQVLNRFLVDVYERIISHDNRKKFRHDPLIAFARRRLSASEESSVRLIRRYFS